MQRLPDSDRAGRLEIGHGQPVDDPNNHCFRTALQDAVGHRQLRDVIAVCVRRKRNLRRIGRAQRRTAGRGFRQERPRIGQTASRRRRLIGIDGLCAVERDGGAQVARGGRGRNGGRTRFDRRQNDVVIGDEQTVRDSELQYGQLQWIAAVDIACIAERHSDAGLHGRENPAADQQTVRRRLCRVGAGDEGFLASRQREARREVRAREIERGLNGLSAVIADAPDRIGLATCRHKAERSQCDARSSVRRLLCDRFLSSDR